MKFFYTAKYPWLFRVIFPSLVFRLPANNKSVYISFDDGPIPEVTPLILDILSEYNAKASFFCLGKNIVKYPEIFDLIKIQGHSVGNHSYDHLNGWKTENDIFLQNIEKADKLINSILFRPPYGKIKPSQIKLLKSKYKIVMWDVISGDFDPNTNKEKCVQNVLNNVRSGSIIVFHDSCKAKEKVLYSLPIILDTLKQQGYTFKKIEV